MKTFTKTLISCILCTLMLVIVASAAQVQRFYPDENGKYTVTYENGTQNEYYSLLVVKGTYTENNNPEITEDNIIYIAQETADENGNVTFADFTPKEMADGTVYIGGSNLDSALLLGYIGETGLETISVPAGSTVYFYFEDDKTVTKCPYEANIGVPVKKGFIYVNTGYSAQTIYSVDENGMPTKIDVFDNAVLGFGRAGIRTDGINGIRFRSSVSTTSKDLTVSQDKYEVKEYGFLVAAETSVTGLVDGTYTLDMSYVEKGKAIKGIAYNKSLNKDIVYDQDDENQRTIFTAIVHGVPLNRTALRSALVSRPYYIFTDGTEEFIVYGESTRRSIYDVAKAIKNENGSDYADHKEYIDKVVELAERDDVDIDVSDLISK